MNMNNTNPDNPPKRYIPRKIDWDWRDSVISELQKLHVPFQIATVSVIDQRESLDSCAKNKLTPKQTADLLISVIERVYNKGNEFTPL